VRNAIVPVFSKHGLSVTQDLATSANLILCTTYIMHSSGQVLKFGPLSMPATKQDAQGFGSAATYARRYALLAAAGVVGEEDDDAEQAVTEEPALSKTAINKVAKRLMECVNRGDGPGLLELHDELTNEEKLAVWPVLRSDERSSLKKLLAEAKAAADPNYIAPLPVDERSDKDHRRAQVRSAS
jgi:hypothetical protein